MNWWERLKTGEKEEVVMKISKWIEKLDIVYFFVFGLAFLVFMSQSDIGTLNKSMITFLCIPIYLDLLKK